jgi:hypothetical protein
MFTWRVAVNWQSMFNGAVAALVEDNTAMASDHTMTTSRYHAVKGLSVRSE